MRAPFLVPLLIAVAGCAAPDSPPLVPMQGAAALDLDTQETGPAVAPRWWAAFADPQLERLVGDALADSPVLAAALARTRAADAALRGSRAVRGPDVGVGADVTAQRLSGSSTIPPPYAGSVRSFGNVQAGLDWNLDLFGSQKAAIDQARETRRATRLDAEAARLMLEGAIVATYLEMARAESLARLLETKVARHEEALRLAEVRKAHDLSGADEVEQEVARLAEVRRQLAAMAAVRVFATTALAELAGKGRGYARDIAPARLPETAVLALPGDLPADLLARRADIAAAKARVEAARAGRRFAQRQFYPNINLNALVGLQAVGLGNVFDTDSGVAGGGAAINLPLFDGGRRRAGLDQATARLDEAIADYNARIFGAVREAADALTDIDAIDRQRRQHARVLESADTVRRHGEDRLAHGLGSRSALIEADLRRLDVRMADENLRFDALIARTRLADALGGGFQSSGDHS